MVMSMLLVHASAICLACLLADLAYANSELMVAFRGTTPSFVCSHNGTTFWHINRTLYDFRDTTSFAERGIQVEIPDFQPQRVTVMTSKLENNNTELKCMVLDPSSQNVSVHNTSLFIIDLAYPNLTPAENDETAFEITWNKVYAPEGCEVSNYVIAITNEKGNALVQESVNASVNSYTYSSGLRRSQHPVCSKLVFSVAVDLSNGNTSESNSVTWMKRKDFGMISGASCLMLSASSMRVSFDKPDICFFQNATYNITVMQQGSNMPVVSTRAGSIENDDNDQRIEVIVESSGLESSNSYYASIAVEVDGETVVMEKKCSGTVLPTLKPGGLRNNDDQTHLGGLSRGHIGLIAVVAVVALALLVFNALAILYVVCKTKNAMP